MIRSRRPIAGLLAVALIFAAVRILVAANPPAPAAASTQQAKQAERERAWQESQKLAREDKIEEAVKSVKQVLALDREGAAEKPERVAETLEQLAALEILQDDLPSARKAAEECLKIRTQKFGANHWQVKSTKYLLDAIDRLAKAPAETRGQRSQLERRFNVLCSQAKYGEAAKSAAKLSVIEAGLLGQEHPLFANSWFNTACCLGRIQQYDEALELAEKARGVYEKALGPEHPQIAAAVDLEGNVWELKGQPSKAEPLYRQAIELRRKQLGDSDPNSRVSMASLTRVLGQQAQQALEKEDFSAARAKWVEIGKWESILFGAAHAEVATARREAEFFEHLQRLPVASARKLVKAEQLVKKVFELRLQGKLDAAVPLAQEALQLRQTLLGDGDLRTAASLHLLGVLYGDLGRHAEADPLLKKALAIYRKILGEDHALTALSLESLGWSYLNRTPNDLQQAAAFYEQAMKIRKATGGEENLDYAATLNQLGAIYGDLERYADGTAMFEKALAIRRKILGENNALTALSQHNLAWSYKSRGDFNFKRAAGLYEQALKTRKALFGEDNLDYAATASQLGEVYVGLGRCAEAEALLVKALEVQKKRLGEKNLDTAETLDDLGQLDYARADFAAAKAHYAEALQIRRELLGDKNMQTATSLGHMACVLVSQGDYAAGLDHLAQLSACVRGALGENHPMSIAISRMLPLFQQTSQGRFAATQPDLEKMLVFCKAFFGEKNPTTATIIGCLASMYYQADDYVAAKPLYEQSLAIFREVYGENNANTASAYDNLADLFEAQGDYVRAETFYRKALAIREKTVGKTHPDYAASLQSLGTLYREQQQYAQAERLLLESNEILKKVYGENHAEYAGGLNALGLLYDSQGDYERAEPLYRQAMEIRKKTLGEGHPWYAASLNNLALVCQAKGDFAQAQRLQFQALEIRRKALGENHLDYAQSLNNLAWLYHHQGDYSRAEPLYRQAVAMVRRHVQSAAVIQSQRQQLAMLQSVAFYFENYLSLAVQSGKFVEPAYRETLAWKGMVLQRQKQARAVADRAELVPVFQQLQRVAARLAHMARATPDPKKESGWREEVDRLSLEKERLEAELSARSSAYRQARKQPTLEEIQAALPQDAVLLDFLEYAQYTPPDRAKGTPGSTQRRLLAFIVRNGRPVELVGLGPLTPVAHAIDTWRQTFGMSPPGAAAGRLLRQRLWVPLESRFEKARIVLISPTGILGKLPFGALPGKDPGTYLVEERTFALVPVPSMIPELVGELGRKQLPKNLLLLGDVDYDARPGKAPAVKVARPFGRQPLPVGIRSGEIHFEPLIATQEEIAAIEKMYENDFSSDREGLTTLERQRATKRAFWEEAPRHRYLHVATHGFFLPEELPPAPSADAKQSARTEPFDRQRRASDFSIGLASGLALAGANHAAEIGLTAGPSGEEPDDGILTAEEVGTMNLDGVQLVTLSACETSLGKMAGGEGLLGLQRAFQAAGAQTVVASLWKVDDKATRDLMSRFYRNHWEKQMGLLEALHDAQLWMLREGQSRNMKRLDVPAPAAPKDGRLSPQFWAAFVLSGNWR